MSAELEIELRVIEILSSGVPADSRKIDIHSRLVDDLYMDSMSLIEIILDLNHVFGIQFSEVEVGEWRTVADICSSVRRS